MGLPILEHNVFGYRERGEFFEEEDSLQPYFRRAVFEKSQCFLQANNIEKFVAAKGEVRVEKMLYKNRQIGEKRFTIS